MSGGGEYCTLISSDGFQFTILRDAACVSGTLRSLLGSTFSESATGIVRLESIEGVLLEKVCEYFYYHLKYRDAKEVPEFQFGPELALNLLVAADFLDGTPFHPISLQKKFTETDSSSLILESTQARNS